MISWLEYENKHNNKEYEFEEICDSRVYSKKSDSSYLLSFCYFVLLKYYPKDKNTWEPTLEVLYLCKIISNFYYDYLKKLIAISLLIDSTLSMVRLIIKLKVKALNIIGWTIK